MELKPHPRHELGPTEKFRDYESAVDRAEYLDKIQRTISYVSEDGSCSALGIGLGGHVRIWNDKRRGGKDCCNHGHHAGWRWKCLRKPMHYGQCVVWK